MTKIDEDSFVPIRIIEICEGGKRTSYISCERLKNIDSFGTSSNSGGYFLTLESPRQRTYVKTDKESISRLCEIFKVKLNDVPGCPHGVSKLENEFNL
jgi:hypothetical protein